MESYCQPNDKVLLLSSNESENSNLFTETEAEKISSVIGNENYLTRATEGQITHYDKPLYHVVLSKTQLLSGELLVSLIKLIIPNGKLVIMKTPGKDCQSGALVSCLKLSGYVNINETPNEIVAYKPNYEIGSSVKINPTLEAQTNTNGHETKAPAAKVWSLAAMDLTMTDNDVELINDDDLLDEEDKKKPDAASLRVCETTKKRKACANCSCGLAEELEQEVKDNIKQNSQNAKSSCGSCYLGDAFRCASCPYLGMPAFKPGEKVVLDMSSDL